MTAYLALFLVILVVTSLVGIGSVSLYHYVIGLRRRAALRRTLPKEYRW